jgi:hypothetical protein
MNVRIIIALGALALAYGCAEDPPTIHEGETRVELTVVGDTSVYDTTISTPVPLAGAEFTFASEYGKQFYVADENGRVVIDGLPSSFYNVAARARHPEFEFILLAGNLNDAPIISGSTLIDTIEARQIANTGVEIHEIYAGGPDNNFFYFYDQFIELYNYSGETKYLDGWIVYRVSGNRDEGGPGFDAGADGDIDGAIYIFKFPGEPGEKNIPFPPDSYVVLAQDAVDHRNSISTSIDLTNADWEFYNQYSSTDIDNPNVPNLSNLRSEKTVDFMINLVSDVIVVSNGEDAVWEDGIDIETIVDAVEYQSKTYLLKTLDPRVDRSFALSPPKYTGQSMQRTEPGNDTNDGLLDWEQIPFPTPGYHK